MRADAALLYCEIITRCHKDQMKTTGGSDCDNFLYASTHAGHPLTNATNALQKATKSNPNSAL